MQRKFLVYFGLILVALIAMWDTRSYLKPFVPPDAAERKAAVGNTSGMPPILQAAFNPKNESFSPIPAPGPTDWLASISETGQTFSQYQRSQPNRPDQKRTTIYLLPLGEFPTDVAPSLTSLADFASAFFDMPVKQLPGEAIQDLPVESRLGTRGHQLLAGDVLKWLNPQRCLLRVGGNHDRSVSGAEVEFRVRSGIVQRSSRRL